MAGGLISIARPAPEPRSTAEVHYVFVRPSGYDLGEHITPLIEAGRLGRRGGGVPARAGGGRARGLEAGHVRGKLVLSIWVITVD